MNERERDQALLSMLDPKDLAALERLADEFIRTDLPAASPENLRHAADMFEDVGVDRLPAEGVTGFLMAAVLRERAAREVELRSRTPPIRLEKGTGGKAQPR